MYHIIVNPASRSGKARKIWQRVERVLKDGKIPFETHFTCAAGDATAYASALTNQIRDGYVDLLVLGGDGTINEVINGIVDLDRTRLGYIPTGSSNDLARDLKLSCKSEEALRVVTEGRNIRDMDLGVVTYTVEQNGERRNHVRRFAVSSGVGFDASVCEEVARSRMKKVLNKFGIGKLSYLAAALHQVICRPKIPCKIYLDDREPIYLKRFLFTVGMVHRYEGGGFQFCPDADMQDGKLDLCVVGNLSAFRFLRILPTAFRGKHLRFAGIDAYRAEKCRVELSEPMWLHTDGEVPAKVVAVEMYCKKGMLHIYH